MTTAPRASCQNSIRVLRHASIRLRDEPLAIGREQWRTYCCRLGRTLPTMLILLHVLPRLGGRIWTHIFAILTRLSLVVRLLRVLLVLLALLTVTVVRWCPTRLLLLLLLRVARVLNHQVGVILVDLCMAGVAARVLPTTGHSTIKLLHGWRMKVRYVWSHVVGKRLLDQALVRRWQSR